MTTTPTDFDVAKQVADQLTALDKDRQKRVLRWVAESLGLEVGAPAAGGGGETARTPDPATPGTPTPSPSRSSDIKSFVESKSPKSDVQFAAVVAYYYRFEAPTADRKDTITADNLSDAARLASRRRPPNPGMTLTNAKNQGYLDSAERGQFRINSVGENLVAMTLPGGASSERKQKRDRGSKKPKAAKLKSKRATSKTKKK
jgi:hypothetical protein